MSTTISSVSQWFASKLFSWSSTKPSASNDIDLEAQTTTANININLPAPQPAHASLSSSVHTASGAEGDNDHTDIIDDFFGVTYSREERRARRAAATTGTVVSRHDVPSASISKAVALPLSDAKCPPYSYAESVLPSYEETEAKPVSEPYTIPQGFFKYGFFCPLLWPLGALMLINFHSPNDLTPTYSPEESAERIRNLRAAEWKWAFRCLHATVVLIFVALIVVGATFGIMTWMKN